MGLPDQFCMGLLEFQQKLQHFSTFTLKVFLSWQKKKDKEKKRSVKYQANMKFSAFSLKPTTCVVYCWEFLRELFTNLWDKSLLSKSVRKNSTYLLFCSDSSTKHCCTWQTKGQPRQWTSLRSTANITFMHHLVFYSYLLPFYSLI